MGQEKPLCLVFGECGGCLYQNISYEDELRIKQQKLVTLLSEDNIVDQELISFVCPSPNEYYYRNRLDLSLKRTREGKIFIGFTSKEGKGIVEIEDCCIAEKPISDFICEVKKQAIDKLTDKYRAANLTIRTGQDGRVFWGGIGRHSLRMKENDYLWTEVCGKRIFYSLETFFQGNLSILPKVMDVVRSFDFFSDRTIFYDLYGGVGLFGISFADLVREVILIESLEASIELARFNVKYNEIDNMQIMEGRVEDIWKKIECSDKDVFKVAMIDPPRAGLSDVFLNILVESKEIDRILYLSCNPESLVRDLKFFIDSGWKEEKVVPFDFFPKTKHLETLVLLRRKK